MRLPHDPKCEPAEFMTGLWPCAQCGRPRYVHVPASPMQGVNLWCDHRASQGYVPAAIGAVLPAPLTNWRGSR